MTHRIDTAKRATACYRDTTGVAVKVAPESAGWATPMERRADMLERAAQSPRYQATSQLPLVGLDRPSVRLPCNEAVDPFVSARLVAKREGRPVGVIRSPAQAAEREEHVKATKVKEYTASVAMLTASLARCTTHEAKRNLRHALSAARSKVARVA